MAVERVSGKDGIGVMYYELGVMNYEFVRAGIKNNYSIINSQLQFSILNVNDYSKGCNTNP